MFHISSIGEEYKIEHTINEGAFAKIKLATHIATGEQVAIKILKKKATSKHQTNKKNIIREVTMLRCLDHPHIVKYIDLLEDDNAYYIIMEYVEGMQLFDKILRKSANSDETISSSSDSSSNSSGISTGSPLDKIIEDIIRNNKEVKENLAAVESGSPPTTGAKSWFTGDKRSISAISQLKVKKYFAQIVSALGHCHAKFIAHRDIKLENILVDRNDNIKIVDFGLANFMKSKSSTFCGSIFYIAPEIFSGEENYSSIKSDIWSLGIVLYAMLTGKLPFGGSTDAIVTKRILTKDPLIPEYLDEHASNLITQMLVKNPVDRITLSGIRDHEWCAGTVLPLYLPEKLLNIKCPRFIDNFVIDKMVKMGYDDVDVIISIRRNDPTECAVVYHALCEKYSINVIIRDMVNELDGKAVRAHNQTPKKDIIISADMESPELPRKGQIKSSLVGSKILEKFSSSKKRISRPAAPI